MYAGYKCRFHFLDSFHQTTPDLVLSRKNTNASATFLSQTNQKEENLFYVCVMMVAEPFDVGNFIVNQIIEGKEKK